MNKKRMAILITVLLLVLAACSRGFNDDAANGGWGWQAERDRTAMYSMHQSAPGNAVMAPPMADMPVSAPAGGGTFGSAGNVTWEEVAGTNERHVIRRASLTMESEDFDTTVDALRAAAPAVNGYIESEVLTGTGARRLTIVLRVPVAAFDYALRHVQTLGTVTHQNQWADDVTAQFYDLAGNLETRRIEEDRILDLIDRAGDIHELLALEARLSNVRQTIASYLAQLNQMAGLVSYSTITVTLTEDSPPVVPAGLTLGERIGGAFGDSVDGTVSVLQGIVVFLAAAVIPLALLAVVGLVIWLIVKTVKKRTAYTPAV